MSKIPNHGLFTRTAAASSRSTAASLMAKSRRGAHRHRSSSLAPRHPAHGTSNAQPSSSAHHHASNAPVFYGPELPPPSYWASLSSDPTSSTLVDSSLASSNTSNASISLQTDSIVKIYPGVPASSTSFLASTNPFEPFYTFDLDSSMIARGRTAARNLPVSVSSSHNLASLRRTTAVSSLKLNSTGPEPSTCHETASNLLATATATSALILAAKQASLFHPSLHVSALSSMQLSQPHRRFHASSYVEAESSSRSSARSRDYSTSFYRDVPSRNVAFGDVPISFSVDTDSPGREADLPLGLWPVETTNLVHQMDALGLHTKTLSNVTLGLDAPMSSQPNMADASPGFDTANPGPSSSESWSHTADVGPSPARIHSDAGRILEVPDYSMPIGPRPLSRGSNGSSSSSSSSSSGSSTPTSSRPPNLVLSTATQDPSSSSGSGSATPSTTPPSTSVLNESGFLGSSAGAMASHGRDLYGKHLAISDVDANQSGGLPPLWARAFSMPKSRKASFTFEHGAYGIPKRHPWAVAKGNVKGKQKAVEPPRRSGAVGMLAAAADFLTGPATRAPPPTKAIRLGHHPTEVVGPDGRKRGLNSDIRENGRIVQDRLESVQVGEDAYFLRPDSIGVADGVGGWASRPGADPALFSRLLMHFCAAELGKYDELSTDELAAEGGKLLQDWEEVDPVEIMHTAWERCVRASRREGILGSSTALIAVLRGDELRIANLGDCVLLIIRAGQLLFRSTEQQHSFNFPVQLGMMGHTAESVTLAANRTLNREGFLKSGASDDLDDESLEPLGSSRQKKNNSPGSNGSSSASSDVADEAEWDEPRRDAGRWTIKVQKGDIIILGSDGLVDNLFDEDIVEEVLKFAPPPPQPASSTSDDLGAGSATDSDVGSETSSIDASEYSNDTASSSDSTAYTLPPDFSPQLVSEALCSRAKAVSEDSRAISSPFQQRAMEEGLHYVGGKHDDISVLVAVVGDASERLEFSAGDLGFAMDTSHSSGTGQEQVHLTS